MSQSSAASSNPPPSSPTPSEPGSPLLQSASGVVESPGLTKEKSASIPYRSLKVGLLRQQRGHSPPSVVRSQSLSGVGSAGPSSSAGVATDDERPSTDRSLSADHMPSSASMSPILLASPLIPMCTHRDTSNSKDVGFCHDCAIEQSMPVDVVSIFNHDLTGDLLAHSAATHGRKSSAPLSSSGTPSPSNRASVANGGSGSGGNTAAGGSGHKHTFSTPNVVLIRSPVPHSRSSSQSSTDDGDASHSSSATVLSPHLLAPSLSSSTPNSATVDQVRQLHTRGRSFSGTPSPTGTPESPHLSALTQMEQRRQQSAACTARKAARWNAMTSSSEPVKALPIGSVHQQHQLQSQQQQTSGTNVSNATTADTSSSSETTPSSASSSSYSSPSIRPPLAVKVPPRSSDQ